MAPRTNIISARLSNSPEEARARVGTGTQGGVDRVLERNGAPYAGYPPPKKSDALPRIFCRHLRASVGMSGHL